MAERLIPLPEMQAVIDELLTAYGPAAIPTYTTDGTTCLILTEPGERSSTMYVAIVQIELGTHEVTAREINAEPGDISILNLEVVR